MTTDTNTTAHQSYHIKLMRDLYGGAFNPNHVTDEHVAILENIIQTKLTSNARTIIAYRYQFNKSSSFIADTIGTTVHTLRLFEQDILRQLREHILPAPMPIAIEAMELSIRAYNSLKRANINTLDAIEKLSDSDLRSIRNIGDKTLTEIHQEIKRTIARRAALYIDDKIINYADIGICPVCGSDDHNVVEVDNGYGESYYSTKCNTCNSTWKQTFHEIQVNDGYDEIEDADGNPVNVIIANQPMLDIDTLIHDAQHCTACSAPCALSVDGVCRYPLIYGKRPTNCRDGFELTTVTK